MASQSQTEDLKVEHKESSSEDSSSETDSEDELARSRIDDDDPRWQKVTYDGGVKKVYILYIIYITL